MTGPTISMQDIADLACVRRPVVSVWRRRSRDRGTPFPAPIAVVAGVERFDHQAVLGWLVDTGRGNNDDAALDAGALTVPPGAMLEDVVTLLSLQAATGMDLAGLDGPGLAAAATVADPDDVFLRREVAAVPDARSMARYVDNLVEASFGAADALDRVTSGPLARQAGGRGLAEGAAKVLGALAAVACVHLGAEGVALAPPLGDPGLGLRLSREGFAGVHLDGDEAAVRGWRRRAVICAIEILDRAMPTVHVLSLVGEAAPAVLEALDDLVLSLGPSDVALALGPASLLCEALIGDAERRRAQTLRGGRLVMALRLPRGQSKAAHRQALGVWVLHGGRAEPRPLVADLDAAHIDVDDLASDLAAAFDMAGHRAYRYGRRVMAADIVSGGPVVPRGVRAVQVHTREPGTHLDRIYAATLVTSEPLPGVDVTVSPAAGGFVLNRRSLAELEAVKQVRMYRGRRVDTAGADPGGTVRVLGIRPVDDVRLDPLEAVRLYPRAERTEPGDVVFVQRPRPLARVDGEGGCLVAAPCRFLRLLAGAPVGPHTLATIINQLAVAGSDWQTWSVPNLPPGDAEALDAALAAAAAHLRQVRRRERAVQDLTTALIEGVAAGAVTVHVTSDRKAG